MNVLRPQMIQKLSETTPQEGSPVLSVYLDLDPSSQYNRRGGHKTVLDSLLKKLEAQIDDDERLRHFQEDAEWIRQKVEFHLPRGKSLMMCCDVSESFYFGEDLPIRMASQAWFDQAPYVRPIMQAWEEHERYAVVLADREKARFFVISMGLIEEVSGMLQEPPVKHRSTAGSDHMRSQMVLQRRAAKWSESFLKDVAENLSEAVTQYQIKRVILAGPEELTAELQRLLPKTVTPLVADRVRMPATAKPAEVLELALPVIEQLQAQRENEIVKDLVTISQKAGPVAEKAVLGMSATLDAINQDRVYRFIYPGDTRLAGYRCPSCDVLLDHSTSDGKCPYCTVALDSIEDVVWIASEKVLNKGGTIEEIRNDEARMRLIAAGRVGAYLR